MSTADIETPLVRAPVAAASVSGRPYELMNTVRGLGRELWSDPISFIGFVILVALVLTAILAPLLAPFDPAAQSLRARLLPPFWLPRGSMAHLLGTDYLGRDVLSRLIFGARASLGIGVSVVALAGAFGVVMGLVAGYAGGRLTGEMSWALKHIPGSDRLIEYEGRINDLLKTYPLTAICQYDTRRFDGATIFEVLSVHPIMIVHGQIMRNPFYVPPNQYSEAKSDTRDGK